MPSKTSIGKPPGLAAVLRRGRHLKPRPEIDDRDVLARVEPALKRFRRDAGDAKRPEKEPPAHVLYQNVAEQGGNDDETERALQSLETSDDHGDRIGEGVAQSHPDSRPEQHADELVEREPQASHREDAGQRRHDRRQLRNELRDEHASDPIAGEDVLGPSHARVGLEREATETRQHTYAAAPAQLVPSEVHRQCDQRDRAQHERDTDASARRERADCEEGRHRWQRDADLFGDDQRRKDHDAVLLK
jgi:hypothetical protein